MRLKQSGFSLHETLLTIALIGLALLASVPTVANLRNQARMSAGARGPTRSMRKRTKAAEKA